MRAWEANKAEPHGVLRSVGSNATLPEIPERGRLLAIYRRWKRVQWLRGAVAWHRFADAEDYSFTVAVFSSLLFVPLDMALWKQTAFFPRLLLAPLPGNAVAIILLTVYTLNAVLLNLYLSRKTPHERSWPLWVRSLRFLLGGIPLLGLYVVPLWRWIQKNRLEWSRQRKDRDVGLQLDEGPPRSPLIWMRWSDLVESIWMLAWLLAGGFLVLILAACWLAARAAFIPSAYQTLVTLSWSLHLAAFAASLPYLRRKASRLRLSRRGSLALFSVSVFWLLPVPCFTLFAVPLYRRAAREDSQSNSVIFRALIRERDAGRSPLWLRFEDRLRFVWPTITPVKRWWSPPPGVDPRIEAGLEERKILRLYELESYSVFFDAAVLAGALLWLADHQPAWASDSGRVLLAVLKSSPYLLLVGLCIAIAHLISRFLRLRVRLRLLDRHPYAVYLTKTQFLLLSGWAVGMILRTQGAKESTGLLVLVSMVLVMLKAYSLILGPVIPRARTRQQRLDLFIGIAFPFLVLTLGAFAPTIDLLTPTLAVWAVLYPVRAFLLGRFLVPWLLRPFEWKDFFAPDLPIRLRVLLAGLAAPAVLPLGGIAVPFQIFVRHRLWPQAEALWLERKK